MSESFPNPFDPPAVPPPRALESTDEDAELSRALQESLAFEKAECERRRMAEDEALEAAIRASHEEETRRMHDKEKRERQEQEILERSRAEAFREQRRREAVEEPDQHAERRGPVPRRVRVQPDPAVRRAVVAGHRVPGRRRRPADRPR